MKNCMKCGTEFVPRYRLKNYCSDKCKPHHNPTESEIQASIERNKEKSRSNGIVPIDERHYTCLHCSVVFQKKWPPKNRNIFCSMSCSSKFRFSKEDERKRLSDTIKKISLRKRGNTLTKRESPRAIAKALLIDMYFDKKMSMLDIQREYGVNVNTLHKFAKKTGFSLRTISQGSMLAFAEGRKILSVNAQPTFKQGWHTTWEGKQVYYRSSYEHDVCVDFDDKRVPYEMESLRISYHDSQKCQTRTALPDFHLPDSNEIHEAQRVYFFNKINMQDKFRVTAKLG